MPQMDRPVLEPLMLGIYAEDGPGVTPVLEGYLQVSLKFVSPAMRAHDGPPAIPDHIELEYYMHCLNAA